MSNSSHRATQSSGKSRRKNVIVDLATARRMLPLVQHIVVEVVELQKALDRLRLEQELLDQSRRALDWNGRRRRYHIQEEVDQTELRLQKTGQELDQLGLLLVDRAKGEVEFPTKMSGRSAAFSWTLGEDSLSHWRYSDEAIRRPIPDDWKSGTGMKHRSEA